jgi:hypothetical protein
MIQRQKQRVLLLIAKHIAIGTTDGSVWHAAGEKEKGCGMRPLKRKYLNLISFS